MKKLISLLLTMCFLHLGYTSQTNSMNGTLWLLEGTKIGKDWNGKIGFILYFSEDYYVVIQQSSVGEFLNPEYKVKYLVEHQKNCLLIKSQLYPQEPDFEVFFEKKLLIDKGLHKSKPMYYIRTSKDECNKLLKDFQLNDIDFAKLPTRN